MNTLCDIIRRKRDEVLVMHQDEGLGDVCSAAEPTDRDFLTALRSCAPSLIAEVKPRSPSMGKIIPRDKVPSVVEVYSEHAQAISVLCDGADFGGGFDLLQEVRSQTDLPILAKEFIVDAMQIRLARAAGADAVLLIAAVLSKDEIAKLAACSLQLRMPVLLELHDESDCEKIPDVSPDELTLGINNRNLKTMEIDLRTSVQMAQFLRERYRDHLIVSESGIESREDVESLQTFVDGFLIGTTFLTSGDPGGKIRELFP